MMPWPEIVIKIWTM